MQTCVHDARGGAPALREFAGQQRISHYLPQKTIQAYHEERLRDTIERRRRARELEARMLANVEEVGRHA